LRELFGDLYEPLMEIRNDLKNNSRLQAKMLDDVRVR
jgi:protease-4